MKERLQKILAQAGLASRRKAEDYIAQGRVMVDGLRVERMGERVDPDRQIITFDGRPVRRPTKTTTLLLNKPAGYLTTVSDPQGRPIVTDLLDPAGPRLFPVGRLDLETEGALLFTNDGDLGQRILHPSKQINRTYRARVRGCPSPQALQSLRDGIMLDGRRTWPTQIRVLAYSPGVTTLEIIIHEGRKRQIRKMFAMIKHPVLHLARTAYGGLHLGQLGLGKHRYLNENEIRLIFR